MTADLYSKSKTRREDVKGSPEDVYLMPDYASYVVNTIRAGNVASMGSTDANCYWSHIVKPELANNVQGDPVDIVGNASNERGEYLPVRIPISSLRWFPIMGEQDILPIPSETSKSLTADHLRGGPHEGEEDVQISSLPKWIIFMTAWISQRAMFVPSSQCRS